MYLYHAAAKKKPMVDNLYRLGIRNFLYSYEDKSVLKSIQYLNETKEEPCTILVDSGAFSAWNRGLVIEIDKYISFIETIKEMNSLHKFYFINLDEIPHKKGEGKPTKAQIAAAVEKGIENWHYIRSKGHATIHTFHQFESWSVLERIMRECNDLNYIGISPANDVPIKTRNKWLEDVFYRVRQRTRMHVLGLTAMDSLERFPTYSADSSSWVNGVRYGELFDHERLSKPGRTAHLSRTNIFYHDPKQEYFNPILYYVRLQRYLTKLWEKRGVVWNE